MNNNIDMKDCVGYWTLNESDLTDGEDLLSGWDFTTDGTASGPATIIDADTFQSTGVGGHGVYLNAGLVVGKQYKAKINLTTAGTFDGLYNQSGAQQNLIGSSLDTWITFIAKTAFIYIRVVASGSGQDTDVSSINIVEIDSAIKDKSGNGNDGAITRTNLITNGTFDTDSDWLKASDWNINDTYAGKAYCSGVSSTNNLYQDAGLSSGKKYKVILTVSNYVSGTLKVYAGSIGLLYKEDGSSSITANGTYVLTGDYAGSGSYINFLSNTNFNGAIDNVKLEDITFEQDQNGVPNQAMPFDGEDDVIYLGENTDLQPSVFTASVWAKSNDVTSNQALISNNYQYQTSGWVLGFNTNGSARLYCQGSGIAFSASDNNELEDDTWYHLVGTYDGTDAKIYINGVLTDAVAGTLANSFTEGVWFGSEHGTSNFINGSISDVILYNKALTQDEISQLYKVGRTTTKISVDSGYQDMTDEDNTSDWTVIDSTLTFDTDHYVITETDATQHIFKAYDLKKGMKYKLRYDMKLGTASSGGAWARAGKDYPYSDAITIVASSNFLSSDWQTFSGEFVADGNVNCFGFSPAIVDSGATVFLRNVRLFPAPVTPKLKKGLVLDMPLQEPYTKASNNLNENIFENSSGFPFDNFSNESLSGFTASSNGTGIEICGISGLDVVKDGVYVIDFNATIRTGSNYPKANLATSFGGSNITAEGTLSISNGANHLILTSTSDDQTSVLQFSTVNEIVDFDISDFKIRKLDGTTKDISASGNNGTVSGATMKHDGLVCTGSGPAYLSSDISYGTWEFDFLLSSGASDVVAVHFITNNTSQRYNFEGYAFLVAGGASKYIELRKVDNAAGDVLFRSSSLYVDDDTNYRVKITRDLSGIFTCYIKGGDKGWDDWTLIDDGASGSNPSTAYTDYNSTYFVADLDSGCEISNLKINGKKIKLSAATIGSGGYTTTAPSYKFDGSNDVIDVEGAFDRLESGDALTLSVWFKQDSETDAIVLYAGDTVDQASISIRPGNNIFGYYNAYTSKTHSFDIDSFDLTEWTNIIITDDGVGNTTGYVNGVNYPNEGGALWTATSYDGQLIGDRTTTPDKPFNGEISGIKIWNRELTADEIGYLYAKERGNYND